MHVVLWLQGLSSAIPEVQSFCSGALLACEALVHPRSAATWPPAQGSAVAANGVAPADVSYLGVPRFWSALAEPAGSVQGAQAAPMHAGEHPSGPLFAAEPAAEAGVSPSEANGHSEHAAGRHAGERSSEVPVMPHLSSRQPALQQQPDISMPAGSTEAACRQARAEVLPTHAEPAAATSQPPVQQDVPMAEAALVSEQLAAGAAHEQAGTLASEADVQPLARTQQPDKVRQQCIIHCHMQDLPDQVCSCVVSE
jgi:hypothetical protein